MTLLGKASALVDETSSWCILEMIGLTRPELKHRTLLAPGVQGSARMHCAWVITELAQGVRAGFPAFRLAASAAGLVISGVSDVLLPGLVRAAGFGPDRRDLAVAFRPGLSFPVRIACHSEAGGPRTIFSVCLQRLLTRTTRRCWTEWTSRHRTSAKQ